MCMRCEPCTSGQITRVGLLQQHEAPARRETMWLMPAAEDIAIVRRTVMAAYDALLPAGCQRTIYLCDDGKDPKKRKFCDGLGPDVRCKPSSSYACAEASCAPRLLWHCRTAHQHQGVEKNIAWRILYLLHWE